MSRTVQFGTARRFTTHSPLGNPTVRLFCFPHAGGGVHAYAKWQQQIGADSAPGVEALEVVSVSLPGRGTRMGEALLTDLDAIVGAVTEGVAAVRATHWTSCRSAHHHHAQGSVPDLRSRPHRWRHAYAFLVRMRFSTQRSETPFAFFGHRCDHTATSHMRHHALYTYHNSLHHTHAHTHALAHALVKSGPLANATCHLRKVSS
eukprot:SAG31_NODE_8995_length_1350_cov_2.358913_2_plen_204_part_00